MVDSRPGTTYVQLGGGGGNLAHHPMFSHEISEDRWAKSYYGYGYAMFRVHGDQLTGEYYDLSGNLKDYYVIEKSDIR